MRYPPGKKQNSICFIKIKRVIKKSTGMKIIPNMVQRHDDHYQPAEQVNGINSCCDKRIDNGCWFLHII